MFADTPNPDEMILDGIRTMQAQIEDLRTSMEPADRAIAEELAGFVDADHPAVSLTPPFGSPHLRAHMQSQAAIANNMAGMMGTNAVTEESAETETTRTTAVLLPDLLFNSSF